MTSAIFCCAKRYVQQKMADIIFIVKNLFYQKVLITFVNATKVY